MKTASFIETFQKHLLVAEPKRSELVAEVRQHLQEDDAKLGQPGRIAASLNRVHLGWPCSPARLLLIIIGGQYFLLATAVVTEINRNPWNRMINPDATWGAFLSFYHYLVPFILAAIIGRALGKFHRPQKLFFWLWLFTIGTSLIFGLIHNLTIGFMDLDIPDTLMGNLGSVALMPLLITPWYAATAFISLVTSQAPQTKNVVATRRWQARLTMVVVMLFVAGSLLAAWGSISLQPVPPVAAWPYVAFVAYVLCRAVRKLYREERSARAK